MGSTPVFPILLVDETGVVIRANASAARALGQCVGLKCAAVVRVRDGAGETRCSERCAREIATRDIARESSGLVGDEPARVVCASAGRAVAVMIHPVADDERLRGELTPREIDVLERVARGMTMRRAATELGIGVTTVRTHLDNARKKLGVTTLPELVAVAVRLGLRVA